VLSTNLAVVGRPLAEDTPSSDIGPGIVAFTIVVLLAVATFFLVRSMLHQMSKVPPTFENQDDETVNDPVNEAGSDSGRDSGNSGKSGNSSPSSSE
jgi:hypothetical protein